VTADPGNSGRGLFEFVVAAGYQNDARPQSPQGFRNRASDAASAPGDNGGFTFKNAQPCRSKLHFRYLAISTRGKTRRIHPAGFGNGTLVVDSWNRTGEAKSRQRACGHNVAE
jgi:hypothetical protein